MECESADDLSHEGVSSTETVNTKRADSMHVVRHAIVEVNVLIGVFVVHGDLLDIMRIVPIFLDCDVQFIAFVLIHSHCSHCYRSHF